MSFAMSLVFPDGAFLLTDGAGYSEGNLIETYRKVYTSAKGDFAVSIRGAAPPSMDLCQRLCRLADDIGVVALLAALPAVVPTFESRERYEGHHNNHDCVMVAYIPGVGGVHRAFATYSKPASPEHGVPRDVEPYEVFEPTINRFSWPPYYNVWDTVYLEYPKKKAESGEHWVRRAAVDIIEYRRFTESVSSRNGVGYFVGGFCDLTSLTAEGGKIEQICSWPDPIGEPIDPYRAKIIPSAGFAEAA